MGKMAGCAVGSISEQQSGSRGGPLSARTFSLLMLLLPVAIWIALLWQPAKLALITVIPRWGWLFMGLFLAGVTWNWRRRYSWRAALVAWALFAWCCLEEPQSLLRTMVRLDGSGGTETRLCILSINCSSNRKVLEDLIPHRPDLVLIQESPSQADLEVWGQKLWGENYGVVYAQDCAILSRGKLTTLPAERQGTCAMARWQPAEGGEFLVASLRLWPQPLRIDFWNRDCWNSFAFVRRRQVEQIAAIGRVLKAEAGQGPVLVGGDFNSPAGDISERPLQELELSESFARAGRGWGKTITSDFPFHRIDRIWLTDDVQPVSVTAHRAGGTDHRLVKCLIDLPLPPP